MYSVLYRLDISDYSSGKIYDIFAKILWKLKKHDFWSDLDFNWQGTNFDVSARLYVSRSLESVLLKLFLVNKTTWSLKYADQYLLLQFCSRRPANFLQAVLKKILKKTKIKIILKWERLRWGLNPGLWDERQVSNPSHYEGFTSSMAKNNR